MMKSWQTEGANNEDGKAKSMQMLPSDVRIYVEHGIGRMKVLPILKNELPINLIPLADYIVRVYFRVALCNLLQHYCSRVFCKFNTQERPTCKAVS